jgi:hypothetical protein
LLDNRNQASLCAGFFVSGVLDVSECRLIGIKKGIK